MKYKLILATVICILLLIYYYINRKNGIYVKSYIDNQYYFVKNTNNKQEVADTLATIKLKVEYLIEFIKKDNNPEYMKYLSNLTDKIDNVDIEENILNKYTSYSVNKGDELVICLKSKKSGKIHDINLLMYVVLHEIAHIMCPEYGHGPLFIKIFKYITEEAVKAGIYKKIDFEKNPTEYCGMTINSSII